MIKFENNQFSFYTTKTTCYSAYSGKEETIYTDRPEDITFMVNTYPNKYKDLKIEPLVATEDQVARLKEVNDLLIPMRENYIEDFTLYVSKGVMVNRDEQLATLAGKATEATVAFLVDNLKPEIKALRDAKSVGGVELFGRRFDSDSLAKENVTGYVTLGILDVVASGKCERIYDWKDMDNNFAKLNYEQICTLAKYIAAHIQSCFSAEALTIMELAKLSVDQLLAFNTNKGYNRVGRAEAEHNAATEPKVKDIFDQCYTLALNQLVKA